MKFTLIWLCEVWPVYRRYVKQRRWRKSKEYMKGYMLPMREYLSLSQLLWASSALVTF